MSPWKREGGHRVFLILGEGHSPVFFAWIGRGGEGGMGVGGLGENGLKNAPETELVMVIAHLTLSINPHRGSPK